jgi:hypothetical protein
MGTSQDQNLRVFISYAREDTEAANRLYNDLKMAGLEPWLDTQSLLAGQNWKIAIRDAIKNSRYFIPLLSSNSVEKVGYVQKELKEALEVLDEFPKSKIFVIPVRINECKVNDDKLRELHIVDLFLNWSEGIAKILRSVGVEDKNLEKDISQQSSIYQYDLWDEILRYIHEKKCCPFIGPEANIRWIPTNSSIAIKWAEEHGYPFEDLKQLPQVAQYLAIIKDNDMYPKKYLGKILSTVQVPDFSLSEYENTLYAVLADLNLPIYITTNYDHLMEEALKSRGKDPTTEFCRWNRPIIEYAKRARISFASDDLDYDPTPANPLVFHLYGDMHHPISMVLTEQDYFDFMLNMSNLDENSVALPTIVRSSFAISSQLFIGYKLDDMNSRIMLRSIGNFLKTVEPPLSIAIISPTDKSSGQVQKYLDAYTRSMFKLNIFWHDLFLFLVELRNRFNTFKKMRSMSSQ